MSARAKELLELARAAEKLDSRGGQRISEGVLEKLARGESALAGIDVSPVVLPKLSFWHVLWSGTGWKTVLLVSAGVASVATIAAVQLHTPLPVAPSLPRVAVAAAVPVTEPAPPPPPAAQPVVVVEQPVVHASRRRDSTRAGPAAAKREVTKERTRAKSPVDTEPARALPFKQQASAQPSHSEKPEIAAPSGHLDAELGLLRRAYSQLHAGKPEEAEALLDEHAERFPHGALAEPREVARMSVLCKLGRQRAARVRAQTFLALHPKSPFVERVRSICSDNKD